MPLISAIDNNSVKKADTTVKKTDITVKFFDTVQILYRFFGSLLAISYVGTQQRTESIVQALSNATFCFHKK
jgi:hypothetical protein